MQNRPWRHWLATAALCGTASWASATSPLTMVVPSGAGSAPDIVARLLGDELTQRLGQPVVIDNRPGAGGIVATLAAKSAKADGNTVLLAQAAVVTLTPLLYRAAKYDMARDFEAVSVVADTPMLFVANPKTGIKTLGELIAQAKAKPGSIRWATSGIGSVGHIMLEQIQAKTGAEFIHVPYKGIAQTVTDAASAQFEIMTGNPFGTINTLIEQGKLRVLATTGPQRAPNQPNIATLAEKGVPEANLTSLFGFMAPAGTAPQIIARLNEVVQAQVATPGIQETLRATDNVGLRQSAAEFAEFLKQESRSNAEIIKKANITM